MKNIKPETQNISSVADGAEAFILYKLSQVSKNDILFIASDGTSLAQTASLLRYIAPTTEILTFPAWDTVPYDRISPNTGIIAERVDVLAHLSLNPTAAKPRIIITPALSDNQRNLLINRGYYDSVLRAGGCGIRGHRIGDRSGGSSGNDDLGWYHGPW